MKSMDEELKLSHAYHKIDTFMASKDEWDTKEGPGKSMKNAKGTRQGHGKRHLSG